MHSLEPSAQTLIPPLRPGFPSAVPFAAIWLETRLQHSRALLQPPLPSGLARKHGAQRRGAKDGEELRNVEI